MKDVFASKFAQDIYLQKYSKNGLETWSDTCKRVVEAVCAQLVDNKTKEKIYDIMYARKFIPGGRYLYSAGNPFHQVNNCFLFRAEDSREGWADIAHKATASLMTGGGIGVDYSALRPKGAAIKRTGGTSTGPLALMHLVNESGRFIMQGGQRRSAIWAGLNWSHNDIEEFIKLKNHKPEIMSMKEKDLTFHVPMELTNISVIYDTEFFIAIEDEAHPKHDLAKKVWELNCLQAFSTAEPGMSFNFRKDNESLRNAPVSGDTRVLTSEGYKNVIDIVGIKQDVWTGKQFATTTFIKTKENSELVKVSLSNGRNIVCSPEHPFMMKYYYGAGKNKEIEIVRRPAHSLSADEKIDSVLPNRMEIFDESSYGYGFVFGDGSINRWRGELSYHVDTKFLAFQTAVYGLKAKIGGKGNRAYFKSFYEDKKMSLNYINASFIAGWFDTDGSYTRNLLRLSCSNKEYLHKCQEYLDFMGIKSVVRKDGCSSYKPESVSYTLNVLSDSLIAFKNKIPTLRIKIDLDNNWKSYRESEIRVVNVEYLDYREDVYCCDVRVEEHCFMAEGVLISNCTEVTSEDDSDKCNLGTIWINRIKDKKDLAEATKYATIFLLCGSIYSDVPTPKIREVGVKNNRIGLGLGGIYEWLVERRYGYECVPELHKLLSTYEAESDGTAFVFSKNLGVTVPRGVRAIAPTGTIGIIAETTTGIEPLFCKAFKRRYFKDGGWLYQYVVDGSVKRLLDKGIPASSILDSYDLTFKQRVKFQADVQNYVDMAISSTCNLPAWGTENNNESTLKKNSDILLKYGKRLRGFTVYPDGCRAGQPLTPCSLTEALEAEGKVFEEKENECVNGVCGI